MSKGQNCAPESIIVNRDICEDALKVFGFEITDLDVNSRDEPAGCYWKSRKRHEYWKEHKGYFNKLVNPSSTSFPPSKWLIHQKSYDERAGVCSASGRN